MKVKNKLIEFLLFLGLDNIEIEEVIDSCPGLLIKNINIIMENVAVLTTNGFPRSEIPSLIMLNPNFLLGEPSHIKKVVSTIKGDIVKTLFENPYII